MHLATYSNNDGALKAREATSVKQNSWLAVKLFELKSYQLYTKDPLCPVGIKEEKWIQHYYK